MNSRLFELARVLARLDHGAGFIEYMDDSSLEEFLRLLATLLAITV
jgi:hypothetical protein